jgi:O-methyltransferase involved in polyketide biosynthesis
VKGLYSAGGAKEYLSHIDLSAVDKLAEELTGITPLYKHILLLRKKMVRYLVRQLMIQHPRQQVCILAAGLDPLGLEIAEYFPDRFTGIFEVDNAHMFEKHELYASTGVYDQRLHLLHGDIAHPHLLMQSLKDAGYDPQQPTILILEGITYYVPEEHFMTIMRCFCTRLKSNTVIMDYGIPEEEMTPAFANRARVMADIIESRTGATVYVYNQKKIRNLLSLLDAEMLNIYDMQAMEYQLEGSNKLFRGRGECFMEMATFQV